jgi:hypothetical protein
MDAAAIGIFAAQPLRGKMNAQSFFVVAALRYPHDLASAGHATASPL